MAKRYRVAVIGAGDMGTHHVEGWRLAGQEVISVCDIDTGRAQGLVDRFHLSRMFDNYVEAVSDPMIDVVSLCVPLALHAPVTLAAAAAGKHVFCEKPIARSFAEIAQMEDAAKRADVQLGIGFQRNLAHGVLQLKEWVEEDRFGRPLVFNSDLLQEVRPKRVMHDAHGNMGPVVDACCHDFLMWQTVFQSKPKTIYARGGILGKDRPEIAHFDELAVDTASIVIEYHSGDIGAMTVSWGLAAGTRLPGQPDRILGPKGGAQGKANVSTDHLVLFQGDGEERVAIQTQASLHAEEFALFVDAIDNKREAPVGIAVGREMLAVSLAVLESIKSGQVVQFDSYVKSLSDFPVG